MRNKTVSPISSAWRLSILDAGRGLGVGQTHRILCPFCGGGRHKEISMTVTRMLSTLAYMCHRASCGTYGYLTSLEYGEHVEVQREPPNTHVNPISPQDTDALSLLEKYEITIQRAVFFGVGVTKNEICFPMWEDSYFFRHVGFQFRCLDFKSFRMEMGKEASGGGFYSRRIAGRKSNRIVIVEDPLSAMKVSAVEDAFCLFGTTLNEKKVVQLVNENYTDALCHLDWDARDLSLRYQREFGCYFKSFHPCFSTHDPKALDELFLRTLYGSAADNSGHPKS